MRMHPFSLILVLSLAAAAPLTFGQAAQESSASTPPPAASLPTASSILRPALGQLGVGLSAIRLDKWKVPGAVREDTNANMSSISRDLDGTLPTLLAKADAEPASIAATLPVYRNVDALYDVVLRVTAAADRGAPRQQAAALHNALAAMESARHALGDSVLQAAVQQDSRISSLEAALQHAKQPAVTVVPCPAVVHEKHRAERRHRKPEHTVPPTSPK
jgi:hypothetical protein